MSTLLIHTQDDNQLNATKAFLKALKIPFEKVKDDESLIVIDNIVGIPLRIFQSREMLVLLYQIL